MVLYQSLINVFDYVFHWSKNLNLKGVEKTSNKEFFVLLKKDCDDN